MTTTKTLATLVTVAALAATPGVATAATDRCNDGNCRIALNHNEVLVTSGS
jgi:hypothetical protein